MASTTRSRIEALPTKLMTVPVPSGGVVSFEGVENFAIFIDTHRDQPHVGTFEDDIHRGMTRPTLVHYIPPSPTGELGVLIRAEDGKQLKVDPKHKFVEVEWWNDFVTDFMMTNGVAPFAVSGDQKGQMPTSHLRDARKKVYKLKSLRQIVRAHELRAAATVTLTLKPKRKTFAAIKRTIATTATTPVKGR